MTLESAPGVEEKAIITHSSVHFDHSPVLLTEEDNDLAAIEQRYEISFLGKVPSCIVGLDIPSTEDSEGYCKWQHLIEGMAERMAKQGVETARQVHNLSVVEKRLGMRPDEITSCQPDEVVSSRKKSRTSP